MTGKQAAISTDPGTPLKRAMTEQRISIEQLAAQTGIAGRLIVKYRAGESLPRDYFGEPTANALKISETLNVAVDDLFPPREEVTA